MNLMAQIRNDVKGSKRTLSADIELSHAPSRGREPDSDNENPVTDRSLGGETEMIDSRDLPGYAFNLSVSSTGSYGRPIVSPKKVLRRLDAQRDGHLSPNVSQMSLNSDILLEQFPDPPIQVLVTSASSAPRSPTPHANQDLPNVHLAPPAPAPSAVPPAYPSGSVRRNEDLTRFVSSSTASGTTLTAGSTASFIKHPGPKQITHIAPSDIPALPERFGRMVYDRITMKWVKATSQNGDGEAGAHEAGLNDSEDPFRDIESLREDSDAGRADSPADAAQGPSEANENRDDERSVTTDDLERSRIEEIHSDGEVVDEEEVELTSFTFDGLSMEVIPTADPTRFMNAVESDSEDEKEDQDTVTSQQSNSMVLNSYSSEVAGGAPESEPPRQTAPEAGPDDTSPNRLAQTGTTVSVTTPPAHSNANAPTPILRSAMKSSSVTPVSVMQRTPANRAVAHRRSVSFSDGKHDGPIMGVGRNTLSPSPEVFSGSEVEDENDLNLAQPSGRSLDPSARTKRIAEMLVNLEDSGGCNFKQS